jgi:hypothetical protein
MTCRTCLVTLGSRSIRATSTSWTVSGTDGPRHKSGLWSATRDSSSRKNGLPSALPSIVGLISSVSFSLPSRERTTARLSDDDRARIPICVAYDLSSGRGSLRAAGHHVQGRALLLLRHRDPQRATDEGVHAATSMTRHTPATAGPTSRPSPLGARCVTI